MSEVCINDVINREVTTRGIGHETSDTVMLYSRYKEMPNAGTCDTGARYMLSSALDISANFMQVDIGRGMQGENNKELSILCNTL